MFAFFGRFGTVLEVQIKGRDPLNRLAFVTFESPVAAQHAKTELHGASGLGAHHLIVDFRKVHSNAPSPCPSSSSSSSLSSPSSLSYRLESTAQYLPLQ